VEFNELDAMSRLLLDKFYKAQRSGMRSAGEGRWWVARESEIVAGLSLTPIADGHWLTGLLVAAPVRGRGIARHLLDHAQVAVGGPLWLFCHPDLQGFYGHLGFMPSTELPAQLQQRLARYQASKPLVAMERISRPGWDRGLETALR
jgi:GNAT superfamily N-acetyltransferase